MSIYDSLADKPRLFIETRGLEVKQVLKDIQSLNVDAKNDWANAVKKMPELAAGVVLLDSDRSVSTAYGVLTTESSMHRGQYPGHSYVVVDTDGIVRFIWDDPQMAVRNKEILVEVSKL